VNDKNARLSRRNFLLTVGAGGVAGAAALVANRPPAAKQAGARDKRATRGYQASAHVNNYYRTTKV
jgi:hypothetical protein